MLKRLASTRARRMALLLLCVLCAVSAYRGLALAGASAKSGTIALLIPDRLDDADPRLAVWRDAAREEGIAVEVVRSSEFLRPRILSADTRYAGVIVPDSVHRAASPVLVDRLETYARQGGWLMLAYDAATRALDDTWYAERAPLSSLLGISYGLYGKLRERVFRSGAALVSDEAAALLGIPPGKTTTAGPDGRVRAICGYSYGALAYPSMTTEGSFAGQKLLTATDGTLVAGVKRFGRGGVLFVNLPLGDLKGRTDGLPLHAFLHFFAVQLVRVPTLMSSPSGIGGLVFNWHVDSNAAIAPIQDLDALGLLDQGPFSIHFTAGPDTYRFGDGTGLHLSDNRELAPWIARFRQRGDALGDHGGWIHNYFGEHVSESNQAQMQQYLELNDAAVRSVAGGSVREYSAPVGNQPLWVTDWLEAHGFVAYYFTGNSGMAPTRSYRNGQLRARRIWSFPIAVLGKVASFEEASEERITAEQMTGWLIGLSDYVAASGTVRTFYSHPPGWRRYLPSIEQWFAHTRKLLDQGRFRWYTMTRVALFLNERERVQWSAQVERGVETVEAGHPDSLAEMAWSLPKSAFERPSIDTGAAAVVEDEHAWRVVAGPGRRLRFRSKIRESL